MAYHRSRGVEHASGAHLQHLRPAPASRRRPRDLQLHDAGPARRAAHHLRRRQPDAQLLLRRRSDRGHPAPVAQRGALPVNIGNPEEFTILECAQAVLEVTGSKSELCFVDLPVDDPTRRRPDITKARALLGWEPRVGLREGLKKSLEFFRSKAVPGAPVAGNR